MGILNLFSKKHIEEIKTSVATNAKTKHFFEFDHKYSYRVTSTTKKWRNALNIAEDWNHPNRTPLLDLYKEFILDSTVQNAMDIRTQRLLSVEFVIVDRKGKINQKAQSIFKSRWFEKYVIFAMQSIFYGHSLVQIDGIKGGNVTDVSLIPREHIIPEFATFKPNEYTAFEDGLDYTKPKIYKWLCEVYNDRRDIGTLSSIAPYSIAKKTAIMAWTQFVEVFGLPMVIGKTNSNLESEKEALKGFLNDMSMNNRVVTDKQTEFEFKETTRSDVYQVYKELITAMNNEINTVILGGTELTSGGSGGSEARAKVHQNQSNFKTASDLRFITNNINKVLIPKLQGLGLLPKGIEFQFNTNELLSMSERMAIDTELLKKYTLSKEYIERTYKVEIETTEPEVVTEIINETINEE